MIPICHIFYLLKGDYRLGMFCQSANGDVLKFIIIHVLIMFFFLISRVPVYRPLGNSSFRPSPTVSATSLRKTLHKERSQARF